MPSSSASDAGEAGRVGADGGIDGEANDASDLDAGGSIAILSDGTSGADADATLALDGPTSDRAPAEDASADGLDASDLVEGDAAPANGLPSTAPCLTGGHVLSIEGEPGSFFFTGTQTDALGSSWAVEAEEYYALFDGALIEVEPPPSADAGGAGWFLNFNTWNAMTRMQTGVLYDVATVSTGDSFGYTRTCGSAAGSFRVDEFAAPDAGIGGVSMLLSFTAVFAITCDGYPGVLRGCVHF